MSVSATEEEEETLSRRTQFAEDRTIRANERTFAGWMRTSLACIAIGVGFHALFNRVDPDWLPRVVATAFIALGVIVIVLAERRACVVMSRLDPHAIKAARRINLRLFAVIISLGAVALTAAIWLMEAQ